jgi:hypothetical protein
VSHLAELDVAPKYEQMSVRLLSWEWATPESHNATVITILLIENAADLDTDSDIFPVISLNNGETP